MPLSPEQEALCERLEKGESTPTAAALIRQQAHEIDDLWDRLSRAYALVRQESPAEMIQEEMEQLRVMLDERRNHAAVGFEKRQESAMNKKGVLLGPRRGDQKRFPYEPRLVGGRLVMPTELQALHQSLLAGQTIEVMSDEMRAVIKEMWPELAGKFPAARSGAGDGVT
jgi:hypothetical protein